MPRISVCLTYNGAGFSGWQSQGPDVPTVQACVEHALSRVADRPVNVVCAGRTDAGVHATWQVVHFDTDAVRPFRAWVQGTNTHLPDTVSVNWAHEVSEAFSARFSATARRYVYCIYNHRRRSALLPDLLSREYRPLDESLMARAAQSLLGERDFSAFRAANCQSNTPMRNVHHIRVERRGDLVVIDIAANAFLLHMVRNIAGALMDVGAGERPVQWIAELLESGDRSRGSVTATPRGLYLIDVDYPARFGLPRGPGLPHLYGLMGLA